MKKFLFAGILFLLIAPQLIYHTIQVVEPKLYGSYASKGKADIKFFTWSNWFGSLFQTKFDRGIEDNIPFRNTLIRCKNQLDFWLFGKANAKGVIAGKENYLFEIGYVHARMGWDYTGHKYIENTAQIIKFLQDTLSSRGIMLLPVLAPGKASFDWEYVPDHFQQSTCISCKTNSEQFKSYFNTYAVSYIDFHSLFLDWKNKKEYRLFPKAGIHWSTYGMSLAADSLLNYIQQQNDIKLPSYTWEIKKLSKKDAESGFDYDIGNGLNLIFKIPQENLANVNLNPQNSESGFNKPNVLVIGDSYYKNIIKSGLPDHVFNNHDFWYYNKRKENVTIDSIFNYDIILLISTETNLRKFPFGFQHDAYTYFGMQNTFDSTEIANEQLAFYEQQLRMTPHLRKRVIEKANQRGISFDEMIKRDAEWLYKKEY